MSLGLIGLLIAAAILGLALVLPAIFLYRKHKTDQDSGRPWKAAIKLSLCVLVALLLDERVVRLIPLPQPLTVLYNVDYAFKWELMALVAAGVLSSQFFEEEIKHHEKFKQESFAKLMHLYKRMTGCFLMAIGMLFIYPFLDLLPPPYEAHLHVFKYVTFGLHFLFAWLLAICFLQTDRAIFEGVKPEKDPRSELSNTAELTYWLADWPVVISLTLLGIFCGIHWFEHQYLGHLPWVLRNLHHAPKQPDSIDMWHSEEYFMSGAIAFQYLLSTIMWIIMTWGFFNLLDTKRRPLEVRLTEPEGNDIKAKPEGLE